MDVVKGWFSALALVLAVTAVCGTVDFARAAAVTQLDLTGGAANWSGPQGRMLDRVFDQEGLITTGVYQPLGQIVDPIMRGHKTFSLFTSNLNGALAPSAVVDGNKITVDLSSLFFGWQRGDEFRVWKIGGLATGLFNPDTSEFSLSWNHVFDRGKHEGKHEGKSDGMKDHTATFFLQGKAIVDAAAPVAIPASLYLYATGVVGLGSWSWWRRRQLVPLAT